MADTKITALTAIGANPIIPSTFPIPMVDLTDTSMAASGTTKKVTVNQILQAGGTATLASATITGNLTAAAVIPSGSTVPTNGLYLPTANNLGFAYNSTLGMTLNSTGLGVGYTPSGSADKLGSAATLGVVATGATADLNFRNSSLTSIQRIRFTDGTGVLTIGSASTVSYQVELGGNTNTRAVTIDASSNVGIGVTPSYLLHTAVASGANRNIARFQVTGASNGLTITWDHATTKMIVNFSNLPTSSAGLASGDLWIDTAAGNTLKVA